MSEPKKVFICVREEEKMNLAGYEDYQLIEESERIALSPIFIRRLRFFYADLPPGSVLIARSRYAAAIIEAVGCPYEILYWK